MELHAALGGEGAVAFIVCVFILEKRGVLLHCVLLPYGYFP